MATDTPPLRGRTESPPQAKARPTYGLLAALWLAPPLGGQIVQTIHSTVDDTQQPYALYVPKSVLPDRKYPLVISLHAEQTNHRANLRQLFGLPLRLNEFDRDDMRIPPQADAGYFVACPLARGNLGYQGIAEDEVYAVLADVERRYPIDRDRIYLAGISMGGAAALRFALTRPDTWAAVAAVAPAEAYGIDDLAPNALHVPLRLYHGELDPINAPQVSRSWHRRLLEAGAPVVYLEYPAVRHNAWDTAFRDGAIFEWFGQHRRNRFPDQVRIVSKSYRYSRAYWVAIDGLTPGLTAMVDARRAGGEVRLQTSNVDGFTLSLDHPPSLVVVDGVSLRVKPSASISFQKVAGKWRAGWSIRDGKRPGLEGPATEAISGRHIYVYGTLGAPEAGELAARRRVAAAAAAWSPNLRFPVKADTDVTATDFENSDLVLFGSRETNSIIARFASLLPLELNAGAADYGLLLIIPTGKHYALINSGVPWFESSGGSGEWDPPGDRFSPPAYRTLSALGDYVLFRGNLGDTIAGGRFTNDWKVPDAARPALLAARTVTIH